MFPRQLVSALIIAQALQLPAPTGYVDDFANIIPTASQQHIQRIIDDVRTKSGGDIVVVTLPDIGQNDPNQVALQIGRTWKVGKFGKPGDPTRNTGVIILVVPKETNSTGRGQCYVGTGYGAEGFITDADAGDMCRSAVNFFRQRDYAGGIEQLTYQVAQKFANEYHFTLDTTLAPQQPAPSGGGSGGFSPIVAFFLIFIFVAILSSLARGRGCVGCLPLFFASGG